jgi:hypothetical protein
MNLGEHPCRIYDPEKKELIGHYPTIADASKVTGVKPRTLQAAMARKGRVYSPHLKKEVAVR